LDLPTNRVVTHSVRECVEVAFDQAGVDFDRHVTTDDSPERLAEARSEATLSTL